MHKIKIFAALGCLFALAVTASADNWSRFRGPNGTGIAADKDIPIHWSAQEGILWKTAIPGLGNSSPIVWKDTLFLQSASPDGKERSLLCLDVKNGKILWSRSVPGDRVKTHQKNTMASSTPATDGERVYAIFWSGQNLTLSAYTFKGEPVWHQLLGGHKSQHGAGISPMVFDGKVFVANDQDGAAELLAFDAKSGKQIWAAPRKPFRACYSTPVLLEKDNQEPQLIVASTAGITSYKPGSGKENWNWNWSFVGKPLRTVSSPILHQGMVLANSGDGDGARESVAVLAEGKGEVGPSNLVWQKGKPFPYVPNMLARGDHAFFVNDKGRASCIVARTGEEVWFETLGGEFTSSPILVDGKIYAINEDGKVFVFLAEPKFKLLARNTMDEEVMATPAVADNRLYIRGKTHLFCIGRASH